MWKRLHVKYALLFSDFYDTLILSTDFRKKKAQILNLINIRPVGTELFRADGQPGRQTHTMKLIFAFRNFAN
jgi:hypothetical protein